MALRRVNPPHSQLVYTATDVSGNVNLNDTGSFYQPLTPGLHRVTALSTATGAVHATSDRSSKTRYKTEQFNDQGLAHLEVFVPKGEEHYLQVWLSDTGNVRVLQEHLAAP